MLSAHMHFSRNRFIMIIGILVLVLTPVIAQNRSLQQISVNDMVLGDVNLSRIQTQYRIDGQEGERMYLRVQSLTPDFAVKYSLLDTNGQMLADGSHQHGQPGSLSIIELPTTGSFTLQIHSANGVAGQYSVSVDEASETAMPELPMGEIVYAHASPNIIQRYQFASVPNGTMFLLFNSQLDGDSIRITVEDPDTQNNIAMFRSSISGACIRLASADYRYDLLVESTEAITQDDYQLLVWHTEEPDSSCPTEIFMPEPVGSAVDMSLSLSDDVIVTPRGTQAVNLRIAPTTSSPVLSVLQPGTDVPVVGVSDDGLWLMAELDGTITWVSEAVIEPIQGDVTALPSIDVSNLLIGYDTPPDSNASNTNTSSASSSQSNANFSDPVINSSTDGATVLNAPSVEVELAGIDVVSIDLGSDQNDDDDKGIKVKVGVVDTVDETVNAVTNTVTSLLGNN